MLDLSLRDNIKIDADGKVHFRKNDFSEYATFDPAASTLLVGGTRVVKNFTGATAPTGMVEGDTWTDAGITKTYSGGVWTARAYDSQRIGGVDAGKVFMDRGWVANPGSNPDTTLTNGISFTYGGTGSTAWPLIGGGAGTFATFMNDVYGFQIASGYKEANTYSFFARARNGDGAGSWNAWKQLITSEHITFDTAGMHVVAGSSYAVDHINVSDRRLKDNIQPLRLNLDDICKVLPVSWDWNHKEGSSAGAIAQDMQALLPSLVQEGADGMLTQSDAKAALVIALSLAQEVRDLKAKLEALENGVAK